MVRRVVLACLAFSSVACGDSIAGPEDIAGKYTLLSIDGELPAVTSEIGAPVLVQVTAGSMTLDADLIFSFTLELRQTENGAVSTDTVTTLGTFTFMDPQGAFTSNPGGDLTLTSLANQVVLTGEIDGSQLFLQDEEHLFVFQK